VLIETGKQFPVSSSVVPVMVPMNSLEGEPEQVSGGVLIDVPVDEVVVGKRMRPTNPLKVGELAQSFRDIQIINPISIDENYKLIAGNHRLAAAKECGWETIRAIVFTHNELINQLQEIDENLFVNSLCYISQSENIAKREEILGVLGKRTKRGQSAANGIFSTDKIAEKLGVSNRVYRLRRQVSNLIPVARDALRGTRHAQNLVDLVLLSRLEDEVQQRVAELIANDNSNRSLKLIVNQAKVDIHTDADRTDAIEKIKSKFGVPYSCMKFNKDNSILERMIIDIADTCNGKRPSSIQGTEMSNYVGLCNHSLFLLDYFVREENPKIMDNFMGNGVNIITALFLGMDVIGFDLDPKKVDTIHDACDKNFDTNKFNLFNDDGIEMKPLKEKSEYLDGIIADPPYLNGVDTYTDEENDLSNMSQEEFLSKMELCFKNYCRLIKTSSVEEKKFYPVMMKMNYSRKGKSGVVSMDFLINDIAEKVGLTLWDRTMNILNTPLAAVNIPRVHKNCYTIKNWETTLVWIKQ
jgi:ParB family transcriptional regulator, chromosome partitioning protein